MGDEKKVISRNNESVTEKPDARLGTLNMAYLTEESPWINKTDKRLKYCNQKWYVPKPDRDIVPRRVRQFQVSALLRSDNFTKWKQGRRKIFTAPQNEKSQSSTQKC